MGESNVPDPFATSAMWSAAWTAENAEDDSPLTLFTGVEFDSECSNDAGQAEAEQNSPTFED